MQDDERLADELQKYPCLYKKTEIKVQREGDREENAWRNSIFINNKGPRHTLKGCTYLFTTFTEKVIIQIT